jgi:hypothetical protein
MTAQELRLGNWIKLHGDFFQVTPKMMTAYLQNGIYHTQPIKLTEEWLEKAGFEFYDYDVFDSDNETETYLSYRRKHSSKSLWYVVNLNPDGIGEFCIEWEWAETGVISRIQFVHQLQNLYYAVTGQELSF